MDAPNATFLALGTFPPDIWAYVAPYLPGEMLGRLKMTGAKSLWVRLRGINAVKSINLGTDFIIFKSWPVFLNELPSIEELVFCSFRDKWWSEFGVRLDMIPSTVRKLRFNVAHGDFCDIFVSTDGSNLYLDEQLPNLEVLDIKEMNTTTYDWMARLPSSLTNLSIQCWEEDIELPQSIIHLCVPRNMSSDMRLPLNLETLDTLKIPNLACLIPPLSTLNTSCLPGITSERPPYHDFLPRTLTTLELSKHLPVSFWPYLPSTLKTLSLIDEENMSATVSRNIVNPITGTTHPVKTVPLEDLPRSITHLEMHNGLDRAYIVPSEARPLFPPQLTTLRSTYFFLSPAAIQQLPASVKNLTIANLCERGCEHLPRGLTSLKVQCTWMSPNFLKLLPRSLNFLSLWKASSTDGWFDYNTGENLRSISLLPEFSRYEGLQSDLVWQDKHALPPALNTLYLDNCSNLGDLIANQSLPNLLMLSSDATKFTDLAIPLLNRQLTSLILPFSAQISGKCFPFLPRSLVILALDYSSAIYDSDIQHLPRTLKVAYLSSAIELTNACISSFPRHLVTLVLLQNSNITKVCLPDLPYSIRASLSPPSFLAQNWKL